MPKAVKNIHQSKSIKYLHTLEDSLVLF